MLLFGTLFLEFSLYRIQTFLSQQYLIWNSCKYLGISDLIRVIYSCLLESMSTPYSFSSSRSPDSKICLKKEKLYQMIITIILTFLILSKNIAGPLVNSKSNSFCIQLWNKNCNRSTISLSKNLWSANN